MASKWQLIDYFDVWGNAKDGWEVNNLCVVEENIWLDDSVTNKEILKYLEEIGYLSTSDMRKLVIEDWCDILEICRRKDRMPLYSLRRVA